MEPRSRASPEQFSALIEFMERHGDLSKPQAGAQGRLRGDRMWLELTSLLNSIGSGVPKSQEKWKKVWADWKAKTKKKCMLIKRHASGTGGGPSSGLRLTVIEERVVALIGVSAVVGQSNIQEHGLNTISEIATASVDPSLNEESDNNQFESEFPTAFIQSPPLSTPQLTQPPQTSQPTQPPRPSQSRQPPHPSQSTQPPQPSQSSQPPQPSQSSQPPQSPARTPAGRGASHGHRPSIGNPSSPRSTATTPRRQLLRARRNRGQTPFERATSEFVAVEQRRLQLEELRDRRAHEVNMERLRLESERIVVDRAQSENLRQLGVVLQHLLDFLITRPPSNNNS